MYKLQFVDYLTQDVLREEVYKDSKMIFQVLKIAEDGKKSVTKSFVIDDQRRALEAEYISHIVLTDNRYTIYRLLFKVKLGKIQTVIR